MRPGLCCRCAVWPVLVVEPAVILQLFFCVRKGQGPWGVQTFGAELAVKGRDKGIFGLNGRLLLPNPDNQTSSFAPLIAVKALISLRRDQTLPTGHFPTALRGVSIG
jgi:hypothetical protein